MPFDLFIYDVFRPRINLITESLIASRLVPLLLARLWIMTSVARDRAGECTGKRLHQAVKMICGAHPVTIPHNHIFLAFGVFINPPNKDNV